MGFFYPSEYFFHNEMRRIRLSDGFLNKNGAHTSLSKVIFPGLMIGYTMRFTLLFIVNLVMNQSSQNFAEVILMQKELYTLRKLDRMYLSGIVFPTKLEVKVLWAHTKLIYKG